MDKRGVAECSLTNPSSAANTRQSQKCRSAVGWVKTQLSQTAVPGPGGTVKRHPIRVPLASCPLVSTHPRLGGTVEDAISVCHWRPAASAWTRAQHGSSLTEKTGLVNPQAAAGGSGKRVAWRYRIWQDGSRNENSNSPGEPARATRPWHTEFFIRLDSATQPELHGRDAPWHTDFWPVRPCCSAGN